jgi:hypothetical protein
MVSLLNRVAVFPSGMFDFNASQDGRFGWFLITWHPETDSKTRYQELSLRTDFHAGD